MRIWRRAFGDNVPIACTFVTYNRALAAGSAQAYADALVLLDEACHASRLSGEVAGQGSYFLAECRQQQAYMASKLGEQARSAEDAGHWFRQAAWYLDQALEHLPADHDEALRLKTSITRGRIAVGLGDHARAMEWLAPLIATDAQGAVRMAEDVAADYPELDGPEIAMLFALASACEQGVPGAAVVLPEDLSAEARRYFDRKIETCTGQGEA